MKLQKIIQQLDENSYAILVQELKGRKADKLMIMLSGYRDRSIKEKTLLRKLKTTPSAFYALRSRLEDKLQDVLYSNTHETRIKLLQNIANIEQLVYKTPREIAIARLKKIEKELLQLDMSNELVIVYRAFKKLHIHSKDYYKYSALYNKYVAFNLGQDKAEELLCSFCKTLGDYYLSRNSQLLEILTLYKRDMQNMCKLYESHHLHVYKNILDVHFALFSPVKNEMKNDETVEAMLQQTLVIVNSHQEDRTYEHFLPIIDFLYFEYYHQLGLYKKAEVYYTKLTNNIQELLLCSHSAYVYHFFISKMEYAIVNQQLSELYLESDILNYETDPINKSDYVLFNYYIASLAFYSNNYTETIRVLTKLIDEIVFVDCAFMGIDIKLFLALSYILSDSPIEADFLVKSVVRKISEIKDVKKYHNHLIIVALLRASLSPIVKDRHKRIHSFNKDLKIGNKGAYKVWEFLKLDGEVLQQLAVCENSRRPSATRQKGKQ